MLKKIALAVCGIALDDLTTAEKHVADALEQAGLIVKQEQDGETTYVLVDGACEPTILVNIHGGLVQDVYGKGGIPVDVIILDWDQEGVNDADMKADDAIFKHHSTFGRIHSETVHKWEQMERFPEMVCAVDHLNGIVAATYTSVWDSGTEVESPCKYDPDTKRCYAIEDNTTDVGNANLEREYVTLPDGTELDENNGVTFDY